MNNLNQILLEGNLTTSPELYYRKDGKADCLFQIESARHFKEGEEFIQEVTAIDIRATEELAKHCAENLKAGRGVRVIGRIRAIDFKEDGAARNHVYIHADHVIFKPEGVQE